MWCSDGATRRRLAGLLLLGLPLLLSACNLRPLYGGAAGAELDARLAAIAIETPKTRTGWLLREQLERDLRASGRREEPRYLLRVRLERRQRPLAIQLDDSTTRFDLTLAAFFTLLDRADGKPVYRSSVRRIASYNVVDAPFATLIAEQDAERRAAVEISRAIRTRLALFFADREP